MSIAYEPCSNPSFKTYPNTPERAREVGWDRLPEYCYTLSLSPLPTPEQQAQYKSVTHDHKRGYFFFHN